MSATDWSTVATAAQAAIDDLEEVARCAGAAIRARIPEYEAVSDAELTTAIVRNVGDFLSALRDRRHLTSAELANFSLTVEERARNGVAIDDYLLAIAIAEGAVWEEMCRRSAPMPDAQRAEAIALRLACMNLVTRTTASAHRRIELASARLDQERRAQAVRSLLLGGLGQQEARERLAQLGLADAHDYLVVRARSRRGTDLTKALAAPDSAFVLWGEDTVGLARTGPATVAGATLGLAGPVPLADLPVAHDQATVAFETAWRLELEGAHDLASLGLRAAVQARPETGAEMRRRYLAPLMTSGVVADDLLATVREFVAASGRRDVVAARLHVHQNTVSYRLRRFSELTGADLADFTTLAELHWLFTDLDLRP